MAKRKQIATTGNVFVPDFTGTALAGLEALFACQHLHDYVKRVLAPQKMAAMRRRRGDKSASPRDYDCCCPVPCEDGIPECMPLSYSPDPLQCRFRHHPRTRRYVNLYDDKFAFNVARDIHLDLIAKWRQMPEREQLALLEKASAFGEAERRRAERRIREPKPEAAALQEEWKRRE